MLENKEMKVVVKRIDELIPADYNPRVDLKEGDKEYEKLKNSIEKYGLVELIVYNKTTGQVVGGHQRLTVAKDLGYTEVQCVEVELSEVDEKGLNVALNKIEGRWDLPKLKNVLNELKDLDMSDITGFEDYEIDNLNVDYNHIEDLIDEGFFEEKAQEEGIQEVFQVSFAFPIEVKDNVLEYIKKNGKDGIVKYIIDLAEGLQDEL